MDLPPGMGDFNLSKLKYLQNFRSCDRRLRPPTFCKIVHSQHTGCVDTTKYLPTNYAVVAKPRKVQEPSGTYTAKTPAKQAAARKTAASGVRYADDATFRKAADKVFKTHEELFRKLAQ
jgi:hypothetical protein